MASSADNAILSVNEIFFRLTATPIALNWNIQYTREQPKLSSAMFQLLADIGGDIRLLGSCATLLSQVIGCASSAAIWRSVFEIVDPSTPGVSILTEAISENVSEGLSLSSSIHPPTAGPPLPAQFRNTPIKPNSGTYTTQSGTHIEVDPRLRAELKRLTFPNTPGFMDAFFSSYQSKAAEILQLKQFADLRSIDQWTGFPRPPTPIPSEKWFLGLANQVLAAAGVSRQYAASPGKPLAGCPSLRKPDLMLLPANAEVNWSSVLVVGELKQNRQKGLEVKTIVQLANYVRLMFATQHSRRFVHGFTICDEYMRCWIFHRGGLMGGDEFSINQHPQLFLSVILGYAAMNDHEIGFDPTLLFTKEGMIIGQMQDKIRITRPAFFCPPSIASRGTTCWNATLVTDSTARYVLKDSWRSAHHGHEGEMLAKARDRGVIGIVEYIAHEDVTINGELDNLFTNVMKGLQVGKAINLVAPKSMFEGRVGWATDQAMSSWKNSVKSLGESKALGAQALGARVSGAQASGAQASANGLITDPPTPPISNKNRLENSLRVGRPLPTSSKRRRSAMADALSLTSSARKRVKALTPHCRPFDRIHTRVLTRKGRSITRFTSSHELLRAFYGAIKGHRSLYENGILHRDVSINNIMIAFPDEHRPDGLSGYLIDLDMAIEISDTEPSGAPHRTGTMEFMAISTLNGEVHTFRHDLESFYYVFLWICVREQPWTEARKYQNRMWNTVLDDWGSTFEKAARTKWGDMGRAAAGSGMGLERILEEFEDWALELQVLARRIRDVLFPLGKEGMFFSTGMEVYDKILGLLQVHADMLQADTGA